MTDWAPFIEAANRVVEARDANLCDVCKRRKWDGGHALNDRECSKTDGEVCQLYRKINILATALRGFRREPYHNRDCTVGRGLLIGTCRCKQENEEYNARIDGALQAAGL